MIRVAGRSILVANRITMADVAHEAGVSLMTVSRVVNNRDNVSPATRQRVLEIIERLEFRPSGIARGLATRRTGTLGLVMPDVGNPFFSTVARGAEHLAYNEGYNVFLCNTNEDWGREEAVLQSLEERRVDGVVLCSSRLDDDKLESVVTRFPAAVLVNRSLAGTKAGAVMVDDKAGSWDVIQHLLRTGHRKIGFLAGPQASRSGFRRIEGYRSALDAAEVAYQPEWLQHCLPTVAGGQEEAIRLLRAHKDLTALFCFNDLVAVGVLKACVRLGKRVPKDLAVVGFDDIQLASLVTPALTTSRVPRYQLGRDAMRLLLSNIQGCFDDCHVVLQPKLVVRASAP